MHLFRILRSRIIRKNMSSVVARSTMPPDDEYDLQRVLLVSKTTRLEVEQQCCPNSVDSEIREALVERGSAFLVKSHEQHKRFEEEVIRSLETLNVRVKIVDRYDKPSDLIEWADTIISVGGDGTYLMAANKVTDQSKPVIGLNSCPDTSIGYLCLPKIYSRDVFKTLSDIKKRKFTWAYRTRIKVSFSGRNINKTWISVHEKATKRHTFFECNKTTKEEKNVAEESFDVPHLSLNEVFIAESAPASVSYLDIGVDDGELIATKNSGLCVCTGSGSSSWNFTMNRISRDVVDKLFTISGHRDLANIDEIVEKYNASLRFAADDERMDYTIRDMIPTPVWPKMPNLPSKGFARKIVIKSQCRDGNLVIDGGCSYQFNAGTTATLRTDPQNRLKTIKLIT